MTAGILYCGDTTLDTAACYLAGVLTHGELTFDYRPSDEPLATTDVADRKVVILSDYPADNLGDEAQTALLDAIDSGTGLLMIGGWESFHGLGGDWDRSSISQALPVEIGSEDDRMNCDHPVVLRTTKPHPITNGLPFGERPPVIGGFNRFTPKPDAEVLLEADRLRCEFDGGIWRTTVIETHPMLVAGHYGRGKTAALATDAAPHWVGGFVDWGDDRVQSRAPNAEAIEVGDLYAKFWRQLVTFLHPER